MPLDAVAVLLVPVPVMVTVPTTNGTVEYTCLVNVVTEEFAVELTPTQVVKSQTPASIIVLFSGADAKAEKAVVTGVPTTTTAAVPAIVCSAVVTGITGRVSMGKSLSALTGVILGVAL